MGSLGSWGEESGHLEEYQRLVAGGAEVVSVRNQAGLEVSSPPWAVPAAGVIQAAPKQP